MKKILMLVMLCLISIVKVNAYDTTDTFYYDTQVKNMYITKIKGDMKSNGAPFLLHKSNGDLVYCIEPFFDLGSSPYEGYIGYKDIFGISEETINKMNIIAHLGYGYENHTDLKWYGITQYLIWNALDLDDLYFTDKHNGDKIIAYEEEINELKTLVEQYNVLPSFDDELNLELGKSLTVTDENNVLKDYDIIANGINVTKVENNLTITADNEGTYKIELVKKDNTNHYELYYHTNGQNLLFPGKINDIKKEIIVNVEKGNIKVLKHDRKTDKARSNLTFKDTKYGLYDVDGNLIKELVLDEFGIYNSEIEFGSYYIQELVAPIGYLKDDKKYYFTVDFNTSDVSLDVYDDVVEKNITIYKLYGNKKSEIYAYEQGAVFELYDEFDNLLGTYTTDANGIINLTLVYGKYRLHQISSKEGYECVEDYIIDVTTEDEEEIRLYDYETIIDVPNTYRDEIDYFASTMIILVLFVFNLGIYVYRKNITKC